MAQVYHHIDARFDFITYQDAGANRIATEHLRELLAQAERILHVQVTRIVEGPSGLRHLHARLLVESPGLASIGHARIGLGLRDLIGSRRHLSMRGRPLVVSRLADVDV